MKNLSDSNRGSSKPRSDLSPASAMDYDILLNIFSFLDAESNNTGVSKDFSPSPQSRRSTPQPQATPLRVPNFVTPKPTMVSRKSDEDVRLIWNPSLQSLRDTPLTLRPKSPPVLVSPQPEHIPAPISTDTVVLHLPLMSSRATADLYHASLVCKTFFLPAVDILWRSMDSLIPILELLPTMKKIDNVYMLTGEVKPEHIYRLRMYSSRIRKFTLTEFTQPQIAPFTLLHIASLFPEIPHLLCSSAHALSLPTPSLLLTNGLKRFELTNVTDTAVHVIKPFLCTLQARVPKLEHLVLRDALASDTLSVIPGFHCLLSLEFVGNMDSVLFSQIVTLPELRKLVMNVTDSTPVDAPRTTNIVGLKRLETLHITGSGATVEACILQLEGGSLVDVAITIQSRLSQTSPEEWIELDSETPDLSVEKSLSAMSNRWPTLRSLRVVMDESPGEFGASKMALNAIKKFTSLENLHIGPPLEAAELLDLAAKLSNIVMLRVETRESSLDLGFLSSMVKMYPRLSSLNIKFGSCKTPPVSVAPSSASPQLKSLIISTGDMADFQKAVHVGEYLDKVFPRLQSIEIETCSGARFWKHVCEVVTTIQRVRRIEREVIRATRPRKGHIDKAEAQYRQKLVRLCKTLKATVAEYKRR
ncbi:hypothetical protein C0995_014131 [Termitomyces sp. Mi166|nr:hypothetical protein C0995_014131 [Termitomyces sp. Mi166\